MNKKVSVIIPAYNCEKYIEECVVSILRQTYKLVEIIVVDDGSVDDTRNILKKFDDKIVYLYQDNSGAPAARNRGLNYATGELIIFFDADDKMLSDMIENLVMAQMNSDADIVLGNYRHINENGKLVKNIMEFQKNEIFSDLDLLQKLHEISPFPDNKLFIKEIIDLYDINFANVSVGQDLNFFLKYVTHARKACVINDILCEYRIVSDSISRKYDCRICGIIDSLNNVEKHIQDYQLTQQFQCALNSVLLVHTYYQISKCFYIRNREERKTIVNKLWDNCKKIYFCKKCYRGLMILKIKLLVKAFAFSL